MNVDVKTKVFFVVNFYHMATKKKVGKSNKRIFLIFYKKIAVSQEKKG
jgi:hypothetical protein